MKDPKMCCPSISVSANKADEMLEKIGEKDINKFFRTNNKGELLTKTQIFFKEDKTYNLCIFLDSRGKCRAYSVRPDVCREHICENCGS